MIDMDKIERTNNIILVYVFNPTLKFFFFKLIVILTTNQVQKFSNRLS